VPHALEVNPLSGLHPVRSDLPIPSDKRGLSCLALITTIMTGALSSIDS
jgi:hypothetical protein